MNKRQQAFGQALSNAQRAYHRAEYDRCLQLLERAHIIGQPRFLWHLSSHWWMLKAALRLGDWLEVAGQGWRLLLTPLGHLSGRLPLGNTGRARVPAFQPMPFPDDLPTDLDD
jgi:hypothetical protein